MRTRFWRSLKQANLIVQLILGVAGLGGIWLSFATGWVLPSVPGWLAIALVVAFIGVGFGLGRALPRPEPGMNTTTGPLLMWDYRDFFPLQERGWKLERETTTAEAQVELIPDRRFGQAVNVGLAHGAYLQRALPQSARAGRCVEYLGELGTLYLRVLAQRIGAQARKQVWLRFVRGDSVPTPLGDGEWGFHVHPIDDLQGIPLYRIDLASAFNETFGRSGLSLVELTDVRFRGKSRVIRLAILSNMPANHALEPSARAAGV